MALHLGIKKIFENEKVVKYEFDSGTSDDYDVGIFEINKKTGNATILKQMPGDSDNKLAKYAYGALLKHWQRGEFPDQTHRSS